MHDLVLWAGTLGGVDFAHRLAAAAEAGYSSMSVFPWDCLDPDGGRQYGAERRRQSVEHGVRLSVLDPVVTWLPGWSPVSEDAASPERAEYARYFARFDVSECVAAASEAGCSIQLSDAPARPAADLWSAAAHERLLPGRGDLDLASVLQILLPRGCAAVLGPEVVSDEMAALDPHDAAAQTMAATTRLLARLAADPRH